MHLGEAQISLGSQGSDVKRLQEILSGGGYNVGPIDGIFGHQTVAAVKSFQLTKGLLADGVVGPQTWAALFGPAPAPAPLPERVPSPTPPSFPMGSVVAIGAVLLGILFMGKK